MLHPVVCSPILNPLVDVFGPVAWRAGQTLAQRLAAEYSVIAAGRYTDWTAGRLKATVGDDLGFAYAAGTVAADGSTQDSGLAPLHAGRGVLHDASRTNVYRGEYSYKPGLSATIIDDGIRFTVLEGTPYAMVRPLSVGTGSIFKGMSLVVSGNVGYVYIRCNSSIYATVSLVDASVSNCPSSISITAEKLNSGRIRINVSSSALQDTYAVEQIGPSRIAGSGSIVLESQAASQVVAGDYIDVHSCVLLYNSQFAPTYNIAPGTTTVNTYGTTTTGVSLPAPVGGPAWNALTGGELTLIVDDVRLSGSGTLPTGAAASFISGAATQTGALFSRNLSGVKQIVVSNDGTTTAALTGTWSRNDNIISIVNVRNNAGTWQFRVNYINLTLGQTALAQTDEQGWVAYDGSFNPDSALQKLMFHYLNAYPGYLRRYVICNRNLTGAETMGLLNKDFTVPAYV